jgi:hypothetical protein
MLPCHPQVWFSPSETPPQTRKIVDISNTARIRACSPARVPETASAITRLRGSSVARDLHYSGVGVRGPCRRSLRKTANTDREPGVIMQSLATVFDFLFGCHHSNLSRVFTISRETYRVCCDCGTAFKYSLETMSIERRLAQPDRERHGGRKQWQLAGGVD